MRGEGRSVSAEPVCSCAFLLSEFAHETAGAARKFVIKRTHTSIQVQRKHSGLPCAMALRLTSCSPRRPGFFVTVTCELSCKLDASVGASEPHDFTVRNWRARLARHPRPPRPAPTFVTMANAPLAGQDDGSCRFDLPDGLSKIFFAKGLDNNPTRNSVICPVGQRAAPRSLHVIPANAGIQYTAASRPNRCCLWNTGSPAFAGDDGCAWRQRGAPYSSTPASCGVNW